MSILIDKRIEKFVKGFMLDENIYSVYLEDIDETFHFDNQMEIQNFLNKQAIERVGSKELRHNCFDYKDEEGLIHRYFISKILRGEIISYTEKIITEV